MRPQQKTIALLVVFLVFVALNLVDRGTGQRITEQLPALPALDRDDVSRIELSTAVHKVVLESVDEERPDGETVKVWHLVAPIEGDADQIAVRTLIAQFRKEIPLDARVDAGNTDEYGLDAGNGLVVELFEGEGEPAVSFIIGNSGPGGSSFVRLSGDDAIYRARIGGRHRYDRPPAEWRNKVLLGFQESDADRVTVTYGTESEPRLAFHRAPPPPGEESENGPWELAPDPGFSTDQELVTGIIKSLGTLRAGEIMGKDFDGGFSPPAVTIGVRFVDSTERAIEVGQRTVDGAAFVRRVGEPDVFRISAVPVQRFLGRVVDYRDRSMLSFSRTDVDTMSYEAAGERVVLQQNLADNMWRVLEPENVDIDIKFVFYGINTLSTLRGDGIAEVSREEAGLVTPQMTITARLLDGRQAVLYIGGRTRAEDTGQPMYYASVPHRPEVFLLSDKQSTKILQAFGKN